MEISLITSKMESSVASVTSESLKCEKKRWLKIGKHVNAVTFNRFSLKRRNEAKLSNIKLSTALFIGHYFSFLRLGESRTSCRSKSDK